MLETAFFELWEEREKLGIDEVVDSSRKSPGTSWKLWRHSFSLPPASNRSLPMFNKISMGVNDDRQYRSVKRKLASEKKKIFYTLYRIKIKLRLLG